MQQRLAKEEARELLQQRRQWIAPFVTDEPQSERARLFEFLAELTDEDGALAELQDMDDLVGWFCDDF